MNERREGRENPEIGKKLGDVDSRLRYSSFVADNSLLTSDADIAEFAMLSRVAEKSTSLPEVQQRLSETRTGFYQRLKEVGEDGPRWEDFVVIEDLIHEEATRRFYKLKEQVPRLRQNPAEYGTILLDEMLLHHLLQALPADRQEELIKRISGKSIVSDMEEIFAGLNPDEIKAIQDKWDGWRLREEPKVEKILKGSKSQLDFDNIAEYLKYLEETTGVSFYGYQPKGTEVRSFQNGTHQVSSVIKKRFGPTIKSL